MKHVIFFLFFFMLFFSCKKSFKYAYDQAKVKCGFRLFKETSDKEGTGTITPFNEGIYELTLKEKNDTIEGVEVKWISPIGSARSIHRSYLAFIDNRRVIYYSSYGQEEGNSGEKFIVSTSSSDYFKRGYYYTRPNNTLEIELEDSKRKGLSNFIFEIQKEAISIIGGKLEGIKGQLRLKEGFPNAINAPVELKVNHGFLLQSNGDTLKIVDGTIRLLEQLEIFRLANNQGISIKAPKFKINLKNITIAKSGDLPNNIITITDGILIGLKNYLRSNIRNNREIQITDGIINLTESILKNEKAIGLKLQYSKIKNNKAFKTKTINTNLSSEERKKIKEKSRYKFINAEEVLEFPLVFTLKESPIDLQLDSLNKIKIKRIYHKGDTIFYFEPNSIRNEVPKREILTW